MLAQLQRLADLKSNHYGFAHVVVMKNGKLSVCSSRIARLANYTIIQGEN